MSKYNFPENKAVTGEIELAQDTEIIINEKVCPPVNGPHRWRIEEPEGPTSLGCCKGCGSIKEFKNWFNDIYSTGTELRENY